MKTRFFGFLKENTETRNRKAAYNTGLAKVAVQCSADTFVVYETFVLLINICGESPALRVAAKRYVQAVCLSRPEIG
jgi:hypothetical protein